MRDILHFSHANGFPAGSYQVLLDNLSQYYDVNSIDRLAHQPDYPVTDNWPILAEELAHYFERHYDQPVIAVGHSLGGVLSYIVANQRPDLVKALVMLDSPVLTPVQGMVFGWLKRLKLDHKVTPAGRTQGRKESWASKEEAMEYFAGKSLMRHFDPRCIRDYVESGTEWVDESDPGQGVCLRFDPKIEMQIYRTIPHKHEIKGKVKVPAAVVGGEKSKVFSTTHAKYMQNSMGMAIRWLNGGHMFPLELPEQTADTVHQLVCELL